MILGVLPLLVVSTLAVQDVERVSLVRFADEVSVLSGQTGEEHRLWYWDKTIELAPGDQVRQGTAGISELYFPDASYIRLHGPNRVRPLGEVEGARTIRFNEISRAIIKLSLTPTRIQLPGETILVGTQTEITARRREVTKEIVVKNSGPGTLELYGLPQLAGVTSLLPGHQIIVPVLPPLDRGPSGTLHSELLSGLRVVSGDGMNVERTARGLLLTGTGPGVSVVDTGGARILVAERESLHVARRRRVDQ